MHPSLYWTGPRTGHVEEQEITKDQNDISWTGADVVGIGYRIQSQPEGALRYHTNHRELNLVTARDTSPLT